MLLKLERVLYEILRIYIDEFSNEMFDLVDFLFDVFIYVYTNLKGRVRFRSDGLEIFFGTFEEREDKRETGRLEAEY